MQKATCKMLVKLHWHLLSLYSTFNEQLLRQFPSCKNYKPNLASTFSFAKLFHVQKATCKMLVKLHWHLLSIYSTFNEQLFRQIPSTQNYNPKLQEHKSSWKTLSYEKAVFKMLVKLAPGERKKDVKSFRPLLLETSLVRNGPNRGKKIIAYLIIAQPLLIESTTMSAVGKFQIAFFLSFFCWIM